MLLRITTSNVDTFGEQHIYVIYGVRVGLRHNVWGTVRTSFEIMFLLEPYLFIRKIKINSLVILWQTVRHKETKTLFSKFAYAPKIACTCGIEDCGVWSSEGSAVQFARISQHLEGTCYTNKITILNIGAVSFINCRSIFIQAQGVTSHNTGVSYKRIVARVRNTAQNTWPIIWV